MRRLLSRFDEKEWHHKRGSDSDSESGSDSEGKYDSERGEHSSAFSQLEYESDPATLRAVADVMSIPDTTNDFVTDAYSAVIAVQDQCDADFEKLCGGVNTIGASDLNAFAEQLLRMNNQIAPLPPMSMAFDLQFRRNLRHSHVNFEKHQQDHHFAPADIGKIKHDQHIGHWHGILDKMKNFIPSFNREEHRHRTLPEVHVQEAELSNDDDQNVVIIVEGDYYDNDGDYDDDDEDNYLDESYNANYGEQTYVLQSHHTSSLRNESPHRLGRHGHGWQHDSGFATPRVASFGYGSSGDQCIKDNYELFSDGCKTAIQNLDDVRQSFLIESESNCDSHNHKHHHHPIIVLCLLGLAGFLFYKRHQKMKSIRQILNVIDANPELKAQVERTAGVTIPPHRSFLSSGCSAVSCAYQSFGKLVLYALTFFFVVVTSGALTGLLFHVKDKHHNHSDDDPGLLGLIVFLTIVTGEVYIIRNCCWSKMTKCFGCVSEEPGDTQRAYTAGGDQGSVYAPLSTESTHGTMHGTMHGHEMHSYPGSITGTQPHIITTTVAAPTTAIREVRPISQVTML